MPPAASSRRGMRRYYCRNPINLQYFPKLHRYFEAHDSSYIRRVRKLQVLLFVTTYIDKDLALSDRDDIDLVVAKGHSVNRTCSSKEDFLRSVKWLWKVLFPEVDEHGRVDDRIVPYPVRHLSPRVDRSLQRLRNERLTSEELARLVGFFSSDLRMQAYITLAFESLGRPQEICYTRIKDVELHENYGRVWVSSHGKEGIKFLHCIDSFPYLLRWYSRHPFQHDDRAFLFCAGKKSDKPLNPATINKHLHLACKRLGISKNVSAYSLKRNGVTFRRLRGDSDVEIQHVAGWTSTKQLQTYDLSTPEDAFHQQLARRGLASGRSKPQGIAPPRTCSCGATLGFADKVCPNCNHSTSASHHVREEIEAETQVREVMALAATQPELTFAQILERFHERQLKQRIG